MNARASLTPPGTVGGVTADNETPQYRQHRFRRPPGACDIVLVRHGETQAAVPGKPFPLVDGHGDPALFEPDGVEQARRTCERLLANDDDYAAVYVTTLRRTRQTAKVLTDALGIDPIVEPDLREVYLGDWELSGEFRERAAKLDPAFVRMAETERWDSLPGAEPHEEFVTRVRRGIETIAAKHPDEVVVVFTHGGVVGQIMAQATGAPNFAFSATDNCGITHLVVLPEVPEGDTWMRGRWIIRSWNDISHLHPGFTSEPLEPEALGRA